MASHSTDLQRFLDAVDNESEPFCKVPRCSRQHENQQKSKPFEVRLSSSRGSNSATSAFTTRSMMRRVKDNVLLQFGEGPGDHCDSKSSG